MERRQTWGSAVADCLTKATTCKPTDGGAFISPSYSVAKSDAYGRCSRQVSELQC